MTRILAEALAAGTLVVANGAGAVEGTGSGNIRSDWGLRDLRVSGEIVAGTVRYIPGGLGHLGMSYVEGRLGERGGVVLARKSGRRRKICVSAISIWCRDVTDATHTGRTPEGIFYKIRGGQRWREWGAIFPGTENYETGLSFLSGQLCASALMVHYALHCSLHVFAVLSHTV